mmetsp:Transcript_32276/g.31566  ORF Transcript_32276/g.31566 Transcript_32276/m.31566 type:complete len:105 (-) Transcript_32276:497-811(-)
MYFLEMAISEVKDLSYSQFKNNVNEGINEQGEFDRLRNKEKDLNRQIKDLVEELKRQQDEDAKDQNESKQEILNLKKQVNETKTEAKLIVEYREREIEGTMACT